MRNCRATQARDRDLQGSDRISEFEEDERMAAFVLPRGLLADVSRLPIERITQLSAGPPRLDVLRSGSRQYSGERQVRDGETTSLNVSLTSERPQ